MTSIVTTLHFPSRPDWVARTQMLDRGRMPASRLLRRLLVDPMPDDVVVLDGAIGWRGGYLDRLAAAGLARRRRSPRIVITDSTWTPGWGRRAALRSFDSPRTTYCVLSTAEQQSFPGNWGVEPARVFCTPFYWTLPAKPSGLHPGGSGVFAGGDSLRDYRTLLAAAQQLSTRIVVATNWRPAGPVSDNVMVAPTSPVQFSDLLARSAVVVVPLRRGLIRSAGQQTYLNAMALGKVVVVTDAPGVRDHIDDGQTGLVVPPADPVALAEALAWATDPANSGECWDIGLRAHHAAIERFSPDQYVGRLLAVIDSLAA